jgi:ubiquitin-activating enzyme E1
MKKMNASSALIIGMKGLGVEIGILLEFLWNIAKDIILAGVKTIAIHDNEPAVIQDMTANFYITENDIGKPRAEVWLYIFINFRYVFRSCVI